MSDNIEIIGTIIALFLLTLVITNPQYIGLPYGTGNAVAVNDGQLLVNNDPEPLVITERSNFKNSATNDDELGEIIVMSESTKRARRAALTASAGSAGISLGQASEANYGMLLLIIIMLVVLVVLFRLIGRKKRKMRYRLGRPNRSLRRSRLRAPMNRRREYYSNQPYGQPVRYQSR